VFNDGSTQAAGSLEGTSIKSTSETGGTKYLREDGDGTSSWQTAGGGSEDIICHGFGITATASDANFIVNAGKLYHGSTKCDVTADTTLTFATAGNWHDGATDDYSGGAGWCYVGVNSSGAVKLCGANAPDVTDTSGNSTGKLIYWNNGGTYWFIVGAVYVNTSNQVSFTIKNNIGHRQVGCIQQTALSGGTTMSYTSVSLTAIIPANAVEVRGDVRFENVSGNRQACGHIASTSTAINNYYLMSEVYGSPNPTGNDVIYSFVMPIIDAQEMYYRKDNGNVTIKISGWTY
jgi:hypothetical protein